MLYREGKRLTKEDLQGHVEILKHKFPSFFRKENPLPIMFNYAKHRMRNVDLFKPGGDARVGMRSIPPVPKGIKSIGYDVEDGFKVEVVYSKTAPTFSGGDFRFNNLNLKLAHNTKLAPKTDLELLIFLWFYCPEFSNNDCSYKRDNADFSFVIPEVEVISKWDNIASRRKIEDEILIEGTRVSYEVVKNIMPKLGLDVRNEEKVDRIRLFDNVSSSQRAYAKYVELKSNLAPVEKPKFTEAPTVERVVETTSLKNKISSLIDETKIYSDGADWKIKTGGKPKSICKIEGSSEDEEIFNLIEKVSQDTELQSIIEKYSK